MSESLKIGVKFPSLLPISHSQVTAYLCSCRVRVGARPQAIESAHGGSPATTKEMGRFPPGETDHPRDFGGPSNRVAGADRLAGPAYVDSQLCVCFLVPHPAVRAENQESLDV